MMAPVARHVTRRTALRSLTAAGLGASIAAFAGPTPAEAAPFARHFSYFGDNFIGNGQGVESLLPNHVTCHWEWMTIANAADVAARIQTRVLPTILSVQAVLFDDNFRLRTYAHADAWQAFQHFASIDHRHIAAIYVCDEPIWKGTQHGLTREVMYTHHYRNACQIARTWFPKTPILLIESPFGIVPGHPAEMIVPPEVDWVGYDDYNENTPYEVGHARLQQHMWAWQQIALVPRAHQTDGWPTMDVIDRAVDFCTQKCLPWNGDARVVGVFPYCWHGYTENGQTITGNETIQHPGLLALAQGLRQTRWVAAA